MSRALRLALAAGLVPVAGLFFASSAKGQAFSWAAAVNGNWSINTNWSPVGVPNGAGNTAALGLAGAYTVNQDMSVSLNGLTVSNPAATLRILEANATIFAGGSLQNAGTIVINSTAGVNTALIRFDAASSTLGSSGGLVRLNANAGNASTAYMHANGGPVDNVAGHTIAGDGRLMGAWVNDGLISADTSGLTLQMDSGTRTNNNIMQGVGGGTLFLSGSTTTQGAGGRIVAQGGAVVLSSCTTVGGTVEQLAGGTVLFQGQNTWSNVHPIGPMTLPDGASLICTSAALNHDSTFTVNGTAGPNGSFIRFDAVATALGGIGTAALNAGPNINTALLQANGGPVTLGASRTVRGTGRLIGVWVNNGLISADASGKTLQMDSGARTNNTVMQGTGGGTLYLSGNTTTQGAGGRIVAQGGTVTLSSAVTSGGTVEQLAGGTVLYEGQNTWINVQPIGPMSLPDGTSLVCSAGTLNHDSAMTINTSAGPNGAFIRFDAASTAFGGTGTTTLNAAVGNVNTAYLQANGGPVTQGAGRTVRGRGRIVSGWINNGVIWADVSGGTLVMELGARTNTNILQATGGGTLFLSGNTTTQTGTGRIVAQGGTVTLSGCITNGGTVEQLAGGTVLFQGQNTWGNVQPIGPMTLPDGTSLVYSSAALNHDSSFTVNGTAGANGAFVRFDAPATALGGTGAAVLNASPNINTAYLQANGGPVTNGVSRTIRGTGRVSGAWINNGLIWADANGKSLQLDNGVRTNNNIMQATGGGTLVLSGNTTTQGAGGRIVAQGGTVALSSSVTNGGTVEQLAGGTVLFQGQNTWGNVQPIGPMTLPDGTSLVYSSAALNHDSSFTVNGTAGPNGSFIRFDAAGTALGGTGDLFLNAASGNIGSAYMQANGGPVTHGPNRTIRGTGMLLGNQTNQGVISPGVAAGAIGTLSASSGSLTLGSTSIVNIELGGTPASGQYDSIVGNSSKALDGRLNVSLVNGYVPAASAMFDIITGGSITGQFSLVNLPGVGSFGPAHVVYQPTVTKVVMCYSNCDGSSTAPVLNVLDFSCFLNAFAAGEPYANCDSSTTPPVLNVLDFSCFLNKFAAGCP